MTSEEYISHYMSVGGGAKMRERFPRHKGIAVDMQRMMEILILGIRPRYKLDRLVSDVQAIGEAGFGMLFDITHPDYSHLPTSVNGWVEPAGWQPKYQFYFERYVLNRYPLMREERYNWQLSVYPTFVQDLFLRAITELSASIFQENGYAVEVEEKVGAVLMKRLFMGMDFYDFITQSLLTQILIDANGYVVVVPEEVKDGELFDVEYISSENLCYESDELLVWRKVVDDKHVYICLLDAESYRECKRNDNDWEVTVTEHGVGMMPARKFGGYSVQANGCRHFISYFWGAADAAFVALRQFLDCEGMNKDIIPITQVIEVECPDCNGMGRVPVPCPDDGSVGCTEVCKGCGGKKIVSRNLGDTITINPADLNGGSMPDMVRYISGNVGNLQYADSRFMMLFDRLKEALYLKHIEQAQSGAAKALDMEKMYKFIAQVSDNMFDIIYDLVQFVDSYVMGREADPNSVQLRRPSQFILKTDADLRTELAQISALGLDESIYSTVIDTLSNMADDTAVGRKKQRLLSILDPLHYKTDAQKLSLVQAGVYTGEDLVASYRMSWAINKVVRENDGFLLMPDDQCMRLVQAEVAPFVADYSKRKAEAAAAAAMAAATGM